MNLIISDVWHHHASQKRYKNKWIADPTSATSPVSPRFCDRPARPCFCSDHKPRARVYLDSVKTFQQAFLFLHQHWLAYLFRTVQCQQISWRRNCPLFKLRPSATSRYTRSKGASNKGNFLFSFGLVARLTRDQVDLAWASTSMQPFLLTRYPAQRLESKIHRKCCQLGAGKVKNMNLIFIWCKNLHAPDKIAGR